MTQVNLRDGPPNRAEAKDELPPGVAQFTDVTGRTVRIRKLDPRDNMRLARLVGAECVKNEEYMIYARAAYVVTAINGEPESAPQSIAEIEAMADRLGEDGIIKVVETYSEHFAPKPTDPAAVKN